MAKVKKVKLKSQIVLGAREVGPYAKIKELLSKIFPYAMARGAEITGPPMFLCHEATKEKAMQADKEGNADVEVCVPVKERVETDAEGGEIGIASYEIPGGKFAKTIHKGPYEECEKTYEELYTWINEKGYTISGPVRECYLNDPNEVAPEEIQTEIYAPIKKREKVKKLTKEVK
jgi:effector-binding domain-containing protein